MVDSRRQLDEDTGEADRLAEGRKDGRRGDGRAEEGDSADLQEDRGGGEMKDIVMSILKVIVSIFLAGLASKTGCGECKPCAD